MESVIHIPHLRELTIFLVTAAIFVPLFQRLKVSPVLGFLIVGALIGPFGLGLLTGTFPVLRHIVLDDVKGVAALAEIGVVFLLFTVGLELSPERMWAMRRLVFGLGGAQVGVTALAIGTVAALWGNGAPASILIGASMALSSTAIVVKLLLDQRAFATRAGRAAFSVLLFQDLAVVPILFLATVLSVPDDQPLGLAFAVALGKAAAAVVLIVIVGRLVLRPLFRQATARHSPDFFMALTLLVILATGALTALAGLSMALGGFLAGLLLAETEYRHQVEVDIEPFRGLFLGLFFLSVGMGLDIRTFLVHGGAILASVVGLYALKSAIAAGLARLFGLPASTAIRVGLVLGQGGEFALVVLGVAVAGALLPPDAQQFFLMVTTLTMMATPLIADLSQTLEQRMIAREGPRPALPPSKDLEDLSGHIIIAGFGRVGGLIANMLQDQKIPWIALDLDGPRVASLRGRAVPVYYGDASRAEVLEKLGAAHAAGVIVTLDTPADAERTVAGAARAWPSLPIYARARDTGHAERLQALGARFVVPETAESSLQLAGAALGGLGVPVESVLRLMDVVREHRYAELRPPKDRK